MRPAKPACGRNSCPLQPPGGKRARFWRDNPLMRDSGPFNFVEACQQSQLAIDDLGKRAHASAQDSRKRARGDFLARNLLANRPQSAATHRQPASRRHQAHLAACGPRRPQRPARRARLAAPPHASAGCARQTHLAARARRLAARSRRQPRLPAGCAPDDRRCPRRTSGSARRRTRRSTWRPARRRRAPSQSPRRAAAQGSDGCEGASPARPAGPGR